MITLEVIKFLIDFCRRHNCWVRVKYIMQKEHNVNNVKELIRHVNSTIFYPEAFFSSITCFCTWSLQEEGSIYWTIVSDLWRLEYYAYANQRKRFKTCLEEYSKMPPMLKIISTYKKSPYKYYYCNFSDIPRLESIDV